MISKVKDMNPMQAPNVGVGGKDFGGREKPEEELKLKDVVPQEFFSEYMETPAAKLLGKTVVSEFYSYEKPWPGKHKSVVKWWLLENGKAVGWNENSSRGWSFPVIKFK